MPSPTSSPTFAELLRQARRDVVRWLGLERPGVHELEVAVSNEVDDVDIDRYSAWLLRGDDVVGEPEPVPLRLLPQYDAYVLGSFPRDQIVPAPAKTRISQYGRGRFEGAVGLPVLLIDGMVAGICERRGPGRRIDLHVEPFARLTASQRNAVNAEANRIAAFLEANVTLSFGTLT